MLVIFPYSDRDQDQAVRLAEWIADLGTNRDHRVMIVRHKDCDPAHDRAITAALSKSFGEVTTLTVHDDVAGWPSAPNTMFRRTAKTIQEKPEPWLWLEPDAIPLRAGWLDALVAEYTAAGKPFMGDRVQVLDIPLHMSGVAFYPGEMTRHAGLALMADDTAWDMVAAPQIIPQAHFTTLIEHAWNHPTFATWDDVEREVDLGNAVLYHASKDGSLIKLLREHLDLSGGARAQSVNHESAGRADMSPLESRRPETSRSVEGGSLTCDIFIKTHPPDYEFLRYCLRSIDKFAHGFRQVVIVAPDDKCPVPQHPHRLNVQADAIGEGYNWQQAVKLNADKLSDADHILFFDSDLCLTRDITPQSFFTDGKPNWLMTRFTSARQDQQVWKPVMEEFLGQHVEYELMRRHPFIFPRWLFQSVRNFCQKQHGIPLDTYIMRRGKMEFSEFNCAGGFAYYHHRDAFHFIDTDKEDAGPDFVVQKWSWGGLNDEIKAEFEKILAPPESPIMQTPEGIWVLKNCTHISRWVEEHKSLQHDGQTLPEVLALIKEGDHVVDIGAHIGDTSVPFLKRVGGTGFVFAIEPNRAAFDCLFRNLKQAGDDENWTAVMYAASDTNNETVGLSNDANAGAICVQGSGSIPTAKLDSFNLSRVDLLKIDVEGFELRALRGAEQTIRRFHPKLLIEINHGALERQGATAEDIYAFLREHGYQWRDLVPPADQPPNTPQTDILCEWIGSNPAHRILPGHCYQLSTLNPQPWASKLETIQRIQSLAAELKTYCTSPRYTSQVRAILREVTGAPIKTARRRRKTKRSRAET